MPPYCYLYTLTFYHVLDFISLINAIFTKKEAETRLVSTSLYISSSIREHGHSDFL